MDERTVPLAQLLIVGGAVPFVLGRLIPPPDQAVSRVGQLLWGCPLKAVTGVPCATCGATRAFSLAARGDPRFLRFNAFWVLAAVVTIAAGLGLRARPNVEAEVVAGIGRHPERLRLGVGLALACGWVNALLRRL